MQDERVMSQQIAIWELVKTEVAYIRTLKVIQDVSTSNGLSKCAVVVIHTFLFPSIQLFLNCLCNLQNLGILTEIDNERLFCNIPEIYTANRMFWHDNIRPVVQAARDTGQPLDPELMLEGFLKVSLMTFLAN